MATTFEVQIFTNRMIVRNVGTGQSIVRVATRPFSSRRLLIGDLDAAEALLGDIIKDMEGWKRFLRSPAKASFRPMEQSEGGLCPVEAQILADLGVRMGFNSMDIV
ncbi:MULTISPECIES: hypothetical protein [unclassified Sphingomonas]|uniref:hypothetical protein n=1 Tax=unclassified Sphingomonas TaxID=196159 RepID=UPI000BD17886|nr:MAG: hypothetical protein B7Z43_01385 [Sphingomonas sp. 12-62-6]OYX40379.1 MAG: hypothetical protein B7Y98_01705 [Sphingomonas sp. 32-62-10]